MRPVRLVRLLGLALTAVAAGCGSAQHSANPPRPARFAVVFASAPDGHYQIYGVAADHTTVRRLTDAPTTDVSPALSPDGRSIAFMRAGGAAARVGALWVMRADGADARLVLAGADMDSAPSFSPDGRRLAVAMGANGSGGIEIVPISGGAPTRLPVHTTEAVDPSWSPDGRRIALSVIQGLEWVPELVRADGHGRPFPLPAAGDTFDPRWSPDGRMLAYISQAASLGGLYVVRADGGRPRRVVPPAGVAPQGLAWTLDGRHLVYATRGTPTLRILDLRSGRSTLFGSLPLGDIDPAVGPASAVPATGPAPPGTSATI